MFVLVSNEPMGVGFVCIDVLKQTLQRLVIGAEKNIRERKRRNAGARSKSHNKQTAAEFNAKFPKIISVRGRANPTAVGLYFIIVSCGNPACQHIGDGERPDGSRIPGGPGISASDCSRDVENVRNQSPELNGTC